MDNKALYNISYGLFLLGSQHEGKINACITNTCIQVASSPVRLAISVLNQNYTCDLIKKSGVFCLSILDNTSKFDIFKHFGYQSGKNVDKFADWEYKTDKNGCPYVIKNSCSIISCKVVSQSDLDTHTLFIAEIEDAQIISQNSPVTYADYQKDIKEKVQIQEEKKIIGWRCKICGYEYMEEELPEDFECPFCGHPREDFEPIYEQ
ncbi:MAG: flavin reductase [Treponema sp.]|nr:flavin reductase [Treponema sp.]